jgi:hypothetical protein
MDKFFMLDKNSRLPFSLTVHLLTCRECRANVRQLTRFEKKCAKENLKKINIDSSAVTNIMIRLSDECEKAGVKKEKVSLRQWFLAGAFLLCCMIFSEVMAVFVSSSSEILVFHISLFFALTVIGYFGFFVGTNMDFFVKKWKLR